MTDIPFHHSRKLAGQTCSYCRQPLAPDGLATGICAKPECQTRKRMAESAALAARVAETEAEWRAMTARRTRPAIKRAARDIGQPHLGKIAYGIAPYVEPAIIPLPEQRRTEFEAHLREIVSRSFAESATPPAPPEDDPGYTRRRAEEAPEPLQLNASCIACQGDCCHLGGNRKAFLTQKTVDYLRWSRPDMTETRIVETYLSYLPDVSAEGSCVYHGPKGCTLDRPLRADICNSYQCVFRQTLKKQIERKPDKGVVVAGISRDHVHHRSAGAPYLRVVSISGENTIRVHSDIKLPALRKPRPGSA